jgi:hypothetical protein
VNVLVVLALVAGFVLLVAGGESLVRGAGSLARSLGMSSLVVGLTVVSFTTSAPELAVSTDAAHRMFAAAGRALRPGGELWTVFNSALRYRPALERAVGPTEQIARDPRFTLTRSVRRA